MRAPRGCQSRRMRRRSSCARVAIIGEGSSGLAFDAGPPGRIEIVASGKLRTALGKHGVSPDLSYYRNNLGHYGFRLVRATGNQAATAFTLPTEVTNVADILLLRR